MPYMNRSHLSEEEIRARRVLELLMRVFDVTDQQLADRLGVKRQIVQQRRKGWTRIRMGEIGELAKGLGVKPLVFGLEPDEALQYVVANHADLLIRTLLCNTGPILAAVG